MARHPWLGAAGRADARVFHYVADNHWPLAEQVLPRLTRAANHGGLWFATAALLAAAGGSTGRRAALHGLEALSLASLAANTGAKYSVRRRRPLLDRVPAVRHLRTQPTTTSFPSGHSASAAAFAVGVALESPLLGALVAPLAGSVAFSRVYVGVHYPGDVLAGCALGAGAAFAVTPLVPGRSGD